MLPLIAGGVFAVIIIIVIGYYAARFMKGKLAIELARSAADSGDTLSGSINLTAKKSMQGALTVSLVGQEKRRKRRHNSDQDQIEWEEVYRQDQIVEETREFPAGFSQSYQFEILAPTATEARQGSAALRAAAESAGEGIVGSMLNMAAGAADMMQAPIYWHIETRLDVKGVDLFAKRKVSVNLKN